jgi:hypothetical protein
MNILFLQQPYGVVTCQIPEDTIRHRYCRENAKSYIVAQYGKLIITFDEATAGQLYLHGNTQTRQLRYRCKRLSSPSVARYILAADEEDLESRYSSETSVITRTTLRRHIPGDGILHCYSRENTESYVEVGAVRSSQNSV